MEEIVMKMTKILASVSACALAASAMAISAFAEVTNGNTKDDSGKLFYTMDAMADYDVTAIYGVTFDLTWTDGGQGCGGGVGFNSESTGWKSIEYGNEGSDKALILDANGDFTYTSENPIFAASDTFAQIWVMHWWGAEVTVENITVLGKDGKPLAKKGADDSKGDDTKKDDTKKDDTKKDDTKKDDTKKDDAKTDNTKKDDTKKDAAKTGDVGVGLALAGLTIAGAAAFVTKKRK